MMAAAFSYLVGTYFFVYAYFVPDGTEGACWTIAGVLFCILGELKDTKRFR